MRIRIFKKALLHTTTPLLRYPFVCSCLGVLSASIRFGILRKSVHTNCLPILLYASDRMAGGKWNLTPSPTLGGFRFHVLDLRWWRDENACYTQRLSSLTFNGSPADGGPQPSYLLVSHPQKIQTNTSQESASWGMESLCVW